MLHFEVNFVRTGENVDDLHVELLPLVVFLARIQPTISHNHQVAPGTGPIAIRSQRLIVIGVAAIVEGMQRQEHNQRHTLAVHPLIAAEKLTRFRAIVLHVNCLGGLAAIHRSNLPFTVIKTKRRIRIAGQIRRLCRSDSLLRQARRQLRRCQETNKTQHQHS